MNMAVEVDEPRQQIFAGRVDLLAAIQGRAPVRHDRKARIADGHNFRYAIVLDDDIDRSEGGRARSVDQGRAPDDKTVVRPCPIVPCLDPRR
jgi:hypothetical protein